MEKFVEDIGFRIAARPDLAIALVVIGVVAGIVLAYRALTRDQLNDYRVIAVVLGVAFAIALGAGAPYAHHRADLACERWAQSAEPADELSYLRNDCAADF